MTADTIQFVDAISASPTVRLDINEQVSNWWTDFDPGSPRLRRASSANAMTDGIHVSSSSYDSRVLTFKSLLRDTTQDALATRFQALQRELDRPSNLIKYQPFGATKPVFFKTFRSDMSAIRVMKVSAATHELEFEVLAEPFALGLMETVSVGTVNNDPAHASNGCYFDIAAASVIGDVATPCLIVDTVAAQVGTTWGVRQHGTPSDGVYFYQGESALLVGFTNPGGGPSAANSGTGTNNYVRATPGTMSLSWSIAGTDAQRIARAGDYRLLAVVTPSVADVWTVGVEQVGAYGYNTPVACVGTGRQIVDLGVYNLGNSFRPGSAGSFAPADDTAILIGAYGGSGTLDFDYLQLVPADEISGTCVITGASRDHAFDSAMDSAYAIETAGTLPSGTSNVGDVGQASGGFISLVPNQVNRVIWVKHTAENEITKANTSSLTVYYWPRYIFIRPSAT